MSVPAPIERTSPTDLAMGALAARSPLPEQFGAVLLVAAGPGAEPGCLAALVSERLAAIARLRQRLVRVPPGCGRPVWVDDPRFDPAAHLRSLACPPPGDEQALVDLAASLVSTPLPRSRPLWSATVVTGLTSGATALVVVLDHVLADGVGGLAVLAGLADEAAGAGAAPAPFPRPRPRYRALLADSLRSRAAGLRRLPAVWRDLRMVLAAGGGLRPPRATPCSLLRRAGNEQRMAVARADVAGLKAAARRAGGSVNDAVLAALSGGLGTLLDHRGERLDTLVVTVLVNARRTAGSELGNTVTPVLVRVPTAGTGEERLRRIAGEVRVLRARATAPPAIAVLGPLFRLAAALGAYRWWQCHQRRFHTLLSNVRGPDARLHIGGAAVDAVVPVSVGEPGNVAVAFVVLSYAGTLTVTVVADRAGVPELPLLVAALQHELDTLTKTGRSVPGVRRAGTL